MLRWLAIFRLQFGERNANVNSLLRSCCPAQCLYSFMMFMLSFIVVCLAKWELFGVPDIKQMQDCCVKPLSISARRYGQTHDPRGTLTPHLTKDVHLTGTQDRGVIISLQVGHQNQTMSDRK